MTRRSIAKPWHSGALRICQSRVPQISCSRQSSRLQAGSPHWTDKEEARSQPAPPRGQLSWNPIERKCDQPFGAFEQDALQATEYGTPHGGDLDPTREAHVAKVAPYQRRGSRRSFI